MRERRRVSVKYLLADERQRLAQDLLDTRLSGLRHSGETRRLRTRRYDCAGPERLFAAAFLCGEGFYALILILLPAGLAAAW